MKIHAMHFASLLAGWAYSEELIRSLQQYKQRYTWLWVAVELDSSTHVLKLEQVGRGFGQRFCLCVCIWGGRKGAPGSGWRRSLTHPPTS